MVGRVLDADSFAAGFRFPGCGISGWRSAILGSSFSEVAVSGLLFLGCGGFAACGFAIADWLQEDSGGR